MAQLFAAIEMEITEQKLHHLNLLGYSFTVHLPTEYKSYKFSDPFGAENQY